MKRYTQADFDALTRDADGYMHLPTGDWSVVYFGGADKLIFGNECVLGDECRLGDWCRLGDRCRLGNKCRLGDWCAMGNRCRLGDECRLGNRCRLGDWCRLGNECVLGDECRLGDWCRLGNKCRLGDWCAMGNRCRLGDWCAMGNWCRLGDECTMEDGVVQNAAYFFASNIGSANRTAYAYCNTVTGDIYVRAGCWFGGVDAFVKRVRNVHGGTQHEVDYLAFVDFARARFARYGQKEEGAHAEG